VAGERMPGAAEETAEAALAVGQVAGLVGLGVVEAEGAVAPRTSCQRSLQQRCRR
jgi:hypothetical protein